MAGSDSTTPAGARWRLARTIGLVAVAAAAVWLWYGHAAGIQLEDASLAPVAAPLVLRGSDGNELTVRSLRGRVVLITLWAAWCPPCRAEIPRLNRLQGELGPEGLVVLGVNVEAVDGAQLGRLARQFGIEYPVLSPASGLGGTFEWNGVLPQTWLIDRAGRVRAAHSGLPVERSLRAACETLLREEAG
jgi:peroxiredoxin